MKRIIAVMLCLALALTCAAAAEAEKTHIGTISVKGAFDLKCSVPDGYTIVPETADDGTYLATLLSEDESKPMMVLSIAMDELLAEVECLNDLDADALAQIEATFREEDIVDISYMETAHGTKLMVVKETQDGTDFVDIYTIYQGYAVEFVLVKGGAAEGSTLTEQEIQTAIQFLSDLDFVPVE